MHSARGLSGILIRSLECMWPCPAPGVHVPNLLDVHVSHSPAAYLPCNLLLSLCSLTHLDHTPSPTAPLPLGCIVALVPHQSDVALLLPSCDPNVRCLHFVVLYLPLCARSFYTLLPQSLEQFYNKTVSMQSFEIFTDKLCNYQ